MIHKNIKKLNVGSKTFTITLYYLLCCDDTLEDVDNLFTEITDDKVAAISSCCSGGQYGSGEQVILREAGLGRLLAGPGPPWHRRGSTGPGHCARMLLESDHLLVDDHRWA